MDMLDSMNSPEPCPEDLRRPPAAEDDWGDVFDRWWDRLWPWWDE